MACKGKRITNPVNQQTIEFIATAKDTNGQELEMVATWEPHTFQPALHYHPYQDEIFKVLEGELTLNLNGKKVQMQKGESVLIASGMVHSMWNDSSQRVVVNWKVFPAMDTEYFLETGVGLAADGKTGRNGMPDILQIALLAQRFRREFRLIKPSYWLQRILFSLLIPLALLSGRKAVYEKYVD